MHRIRFMTVVILMAARAGAAPITLDPGPLAPGDNFGHAVAISGNTAVVSAHQSDGGAGSVSSSSQTPAPGRCSRS